LKKWRNATCRAFSEALNCAVMKTATVILAAALLILCAGGCSSSDDQQQTNPNASTIPWNRPQSWEGQGMMGNFNGNGPQGSTGH
jgi:hypothetical protein